MKIPLLIHFSKISISHLKNVRFHSFKCEFRKKQPVNEIEMRFIQFVRFNDPCPRLGAVSKNGETFVELSEGTIISKDMLKFITQDFRMSEILAKIKTKTTENPCEICLLSPILNSRKIFCCTPNYKTYCKDLKIDIPKEPIITGMYSNAVIGPTGNIVAHPLAKKMDYEVNLAVVMGKTAKSIKREHAMDYVFGYTVAQDITARDWLPINSGQFLLGKTMDTFLPLGPVIVHKSEMEDPYNLSVATHVNDIQRQCGTTADMIFKIDHIIEHITKSITLLPGDIILTGSPSGIGVSRGTSEYLKPGDCIVTNIEGIGKMINHVVSESEACKLKEMTDNEKDEEEELLGLD